MKNTKKKLELRKQSIVPLSLGDLQAAVGGSVQPQGFIMKDSIIVKTSTR